MAKKEKSLHKDMVKSFGDGMTIGQEIIKIFVSVFGFFKSIWAQIDLTITNINVAYLLKFILVIIAAIIILYTSIPLFIIGIIKGVIKNWTK